MVRHATLMLLVLIVSSEGTRLGALQAAPARPRTNCASLVSMAASDVRITEAATAGRQDGGPVTVEHCRVSGVIDKDIHFVALLPDLWNGRLFAGGGGGFGGAVENLAQASANLGFATVGTDTGHQAAGSDGRWAAGHPEQLANYAFRAVHRTTEVIKTILKTYYGAPAAFSYFYGCSNGGREALMEVQRYPKDFDGVVACSPMFNMTVIAAAFVKNAQAMFPDSHSLGTSVVSPDTLRLLEKSILDACDGLDGVRDAVLDDPRDCRWTTSALPACQADTPAADCVTSMQRAAIDRVYSPLVVDGTTVYPGQPLGGEGQTQGWLNWITGVNKRIAITGDGHPPSLTGTLAVQFFRHFVFARDDWDYSTYNLATSSRDTAALADILNADNPNLSPFTSRGGKLILVHGWADPAANPLATISHYERIAAGDRNVAQHVRLFMMPGVLHGVGGAGPDTVDWYTTMADWVEHGRAPERIVATKRGADGHVVNARPLCRYPLRAIYDGKGPTTDASSFACGVRNR